MAARHHVLAIALVQLLPSFSASAGQAAKDAAPRPAFEVSAIKRNVSLDTSATFGFQPGGRFHAVNAPPLWLIESAFGKTGQIPVPLIEDQIIGAPGWLDSEHYDITAKVGDDLAADPDLFKRSSELLQSLLADRFALKVHHETQQLPIYVLVRARKDGSLGQKLTRSSIDCQQESNRCGFNGGFGRATGTAISIDALTMLLSNASERVVVDRTGLDGSFDVDLEWSPNQSDNADKPSIFAAVQEQLGLKLEPQRGPVDVIVIDHVEKPTED